MVNGENITVTSNATVATKKFDPEVRDTPFTGVAFVQAKATISRGITLEECLEKTTITHTLCEEIPFMQPISGFSFQKAEESQELSSKTSIAFTEAAKAIEGFNEPPLFGGESVNEKMYTASPPPLIRANPLAKSAAITFGNQRVSPSVTLPVLKMKLEEAFESPRAVDNLYPFLGERAIGNHLEEMSALLGRNDLRIHGQKWNVERQGSDVIVKIQFELLSKNVNGNEEIFQTEREIIIPINLLRTASFPWKGAIDELPSIFDNITIIDTSKPRLGEPKNTTMYGPDVPFNGSKALDASVTDKQCRRDLVGCTFYINGELFVLTKNANENEKMEENEKIFIQKLKDLGLNDDEIAVVRKMATQGSLVAVQLELREEGIKIVRGPSEAPLPQNFSITVNADKITVSSNWVYATGKNPEGMTDSLTYTGVTFVQTQAVIGRASTKEECLKKTIISQTICEEIPFDRPLELKSSSQTDTEKAIRKVKELTSKEEKGELSAAEKRELAIATKVEERKKVLDMETIELHQKGKMAFRQAANTIEGFNEPPLVDPITGNQYFASRK